MHLKRICIAKNVSFDGNCFKTKCNNNICVIGRPGAGKTSSIVSPNILEADGSYVIMDPKKNLYKKFRKYLESRGYTVKLLDFTDPRHSEHYNCFAYLHTTADYLALAQTIIYNCDRQEGKNIDPFWDKSGLLFLSAIIAFLKETETKQEPATFQDLIYMIKKGRRNDSDDAPSELDKIFEKYKKNYPGSWAVSQYEAAAVAPPKTFDTILITVLASIGTFDTEELREMMKDDTLEAWSIGCKKTALFVVTSDTDRSMDALANMFYEQSMHELCRYADEQCKDNALPYHVRYILDDFATNVKLKTFPNIIASCRSRNISAMIMLQAESQLETIYQKDFRTVIACCDTIVYLGTNDIDTAEDFKRRANVPLSAMLELPVGKCWIFRTGEKPRLVDMLDPEEYLGENHLSVSIY